MAITTHASNYEVVVVDLLQQLVMKTDEASRCQEIIDRLMTYEDNTRLPPEVVDFIGNYAPIEIVDQHGLVFGAIDVMKKALDSLMKAIAWIIAKLKEIFKYLFDSQYRAKKEVLDLQRRIITITMKADVRTKFENLTTTVHPKTAIDDILFKCNSLADVIKSAAGTTDVSYADNLIQTFGGTAGIAMSPENVLTDILPNPPSMRGTTFGLAGWTIDGLQNTIVTYLSVIDSIQNLRKTEQEVSKAAAELKRKAEDAATSGATSGNLIQLQKEAATKIMMTRIIGYAIAIEVRRSDNVLAFITQIYKELHGLVSPKS